MPTRGRRLALTRELAGWCALAAAWRLLFVLAVPRVLDTADAVHYAYAARAMLAGDWATLDPKIPMLYPLLSAGAAWVKGDVESGARAVSFVLSVLTVIPVYLLAHQLHGRATARTAALLVALWPWLADYGVSVATESTAVCFWLAGAYLLPRAIRLGGVWAWLAPVPFVLLHFTRAEGTVLLLAAPLLAGWRLAGRDRAAWRRLVPYAACAVAALVVSTLYTRSLTGAASPNYRVGFIFEEFDLLRFVDTAANTLTDVMPVMLGPVLLGLLGLGLFMPRPRPRDIPFEHFVLLLCAVQWACSLAVLSPAPRYLMAPLIALSLWSACGIVLLGRRGAAQTAGRYLRWLPVVAAAGLMLLGTAETLGAEYAGRRPRQPREYKLAGEWMHQHLAPGLIFTRKPQVAFYADMPSTGPLPGESLDAVVTRARAAGARYVVADERYGAADVPGMAALLEPDAAPPALRALHTEQSVAEARVVVYELLSAP